MSRVGKSPIVFDDKVQVTLSPANEVLVKAGNKQITFLGTEGSCRVSTAFG